MVMNAASPLTVVPTKTNPFYPNITRPNKARPLLRRLYHWQKPPYRRKDRVSAIYKAAVCHKAKAHSAKTEDDCVTSNFDIAATYKVGTAFADG
jgi:hypothetical protein